MMNRTNTQALAVALALLGGATLGSAKAAVLYEGYSPYAGTGNPTTIYPASSSTWVAQAFTLSQTTEVTGIGADFGYNQFVTSIGGTIFGAIVQLNSADSNSTTNLPAFAQSALAANVAGHGNSSTILRV